MVPPAKAVVGESIPIRATVFREGHDAVNASVAHRPERQSSGSSRCTHHTLGLRLVDSLRGARHRGLWTFRVEGWSDPWETWVHNAEIKIPAGIDVELVCAEGRALFEKSAADAGRPVRRNAALRGAARA